MVGGCLGFNPSFNGIPETGRLRYVPKPGPDGLMVTGSWMGHHLPYPIGEPRLASQLWRQWQMPGLERLHVVASDGWRSWRRGETPDGWRSTPAWR